MTRLKLKRFKAEKPPDDVLAAYLRVYRSKDVHFRADELPPISPARLFGSDQPLIVDLGCGRGEFLAAQAADRPDEHFVGFDLHWKSLWDAINRAHAAGLGNVQFIRADFRRALALVPAGCVREAYVLFPPAINKDSRRKQKQDVLTTATLAHIHRVLVDGGSLHFVSDHATYFEDKVALIDGSGLFDKVLQSQGMEGGQTRFQRFWEERGIESRRVAYQKRPAAHVPPPDQNAPHSE